MSLLATQVRNIRLNELSELTARLIARIRESQFEPAILVYLEEGARVPAVWMARQTGWRLLPLRIQRPDVRWKRWARPVFRRLPILLTDWLRNREAGRSFHRRGPRQLGPETEAVDLRGLCVLILDDAADSGSTLLAANAWVKSCGANRESIRTATLTTTTLLGREMTNFSLFEGMCRFPWSADSPEVHTYSRLFAEMEAEVKERHWHR